MIFQCYLPIFAIWFCYLAISVIKVRKKFKIGIGEGDCDELKRAIRIHGNFVENIPFAIILLIALELCSGDEIFLHLAYITLFVGRIAHFYGLKFTEMKKIFFPRVFGMALTFTAILSSAFYLFVIKII